MESPIDRAVRDEAMVRIAPSEEGSIIVATPVTIATPIVPLPRGSIIRRNDENIIVTPAIPLPRVSIIRRNDQDIAATPALPLPRVAITRRTEQDIVVATAPPIDPLEPANQPNKEDSRPYFRNRMVICLFAIAANWGTTLSIAKQLASRVISSPSLDFVTAACEDAYNITRDERLRHTECVESQLNQCNTRLDKSITREYDRVKVASSQNEDVVQKIEEVAINCSKSYTTLRLLLEDWTAAGGEIPMRISDDSSSEPVCTEEDQEQFNRTMLGTQNTIAMQTEALQVATEYSDESTTTVSRLATAVTDVDNERSSLSTYIDERVDYDINYIDRKTTTIQDGLYDLLESLDPADIPPINISDIIREFEINSKDIMACVSLDVNATMVNGTKCRPNLAALVDGFVKNAKWKVSFLTQTLYDCRDKMEEYKQNAADAYTVAKTFYDGAKTFINIAKRIVFWEPVGDWFDISDSDFSPIDVDFPNVSLAVSQIGSFSSINAMWQAVFPKIGAYYAKIPVMHSKLNVRFLEQLEDIMLNTSVPISSLIPRIRPTDYNPPNYTDTFNLDVNPEDELLMYRNISEFFKTNTRISLGMFSGIRNQYDGLGLDFDVPSFNITEIKNKVTSVNLSFEGPQNPDMDFKLWFLQVANFSDGLIYLDYIVRCYVSIRLFVRYWFATALAMPFIDLRVNKETLNPFRMHPARIVVSFVTSPQGLFIIFLASSAWILGMVAVLYVPLLQSYTSGCVNFDGNGTFITKNLYSVGYNYAYQDGSGLLVKGMEAYDVKLGDTCNSRYTASTNIQNTMRSNVTTYSNFHREVSESMLFARRCIDAEELDSAFTDACCGIVTYPDCAGGLPTSNITCPMDDRRAILSIPIPYELPGISLTDPSCLVQTNESDFVLNNAIFDCDNLKACNVTCPGPHKGFLNAVIERCGCTFEWYLHSKWMGGAFAFLIYTLMNIARVSFFSGVTRLLWKHIYPDRFTILATCDSEGSLITASKVNGVSHEDLINAIQSKSNGADREITKELHAKLNRCLRNFFATGVVLLLGSAVVNGMWMCALFFVSHSLTPSVWQE